MNPVLTRAPQQESNAWHRHALALLVVLMLAGCAATPQTDRLTARWEQSGQSPLELTGVPFFPQERYQCGPAALATTLVQSGVETTPDDLVSMVYVPEKQGSFQIEMLAAARRMGRIPYVIDTDLEALVSEIEAGRPVLVMQNLGIKWIPRWHYAVAVGVSPDDDTIILRSGELERRATPLDVFERTWSRSNHWGFVLLKPGELPANPDENRYFLTVSDFAKQGNNEAVTAALESGLATWPASKAINLAMANLLYRKGDTVGAQTLYRQLTDWYPDFAPAHNNLASVLLENGDISNARWHAEKAVALGGRFVDQYQATLNEVNSSD
jgi:Peptidase_C39 like family/Tetratricopeptide repeat